MLVLANILQPLIDINEAILRFWHDTVGLGWGPSIIGLTLIIRFAILPLTFKQVRSMQEMQRFSPEIQRIRERYKDDKTRQNEELMKLYKEHSFNPLGSCLPLVLQLPFFFGLYQTLRSQHFIDEVHASGSTGFLFIPDITQPLKGHPAALVVMIILYVSTQLGSSYISSLNVQDKNQRRLLFIFPFVFVPVVINFESGLLIYWITTNIFTICQLLAVRKFLPAPEPHAAGTLAASSGGGGASRKRRGGGGDSGDDGDRPQKTPRGGGDGKTATKAAKPAKAASKSNGKSDGGPAKPPPRSPRKKKKRTGRRR